MGMGNSFGRTIKLTLESGPMTVEKASASSTFLGQPSMKASGKRTTTTGRGRLLGLMGGSMLEDGRKTGSMALELSFI